MSKEIYEALRYAVLYAFEEVGLETFKRTSLFMSNRGNNYFTGGRWIND